MKTQEFAGHKITLADGFWYIAGRPMADRARKVYPVSFRAVGPAGHDVFAVPVLTVDGLTYTQANALVNAFNDDGTTEPRPGRFIGTADQRRAFLAQTPEARFTAAATAAHGRDLARELILAARNMLTWAQIGPEATDQARQLRDELETAIAALEAHHDKTRP